MVALGWCQDLCTPIHQRWKLLVLGCKARGPSSVGLEG